MKDILDEIREKLKGSKFQTDPMHAEYTLKWLVKLRPNSSIEFQIAALGHDIERAFPGRIRSKDEKTYEEYKRKHSLRSADILENIMKGYNCNEKQIEIVRNLVENHEKGIDEDSTLIMDCDSISYFETNAEPYLKTKGKEASKNKFRFMYNRVSDKAKKIIDNLELKPEMKKTLESIRQ